MPNNLFNDQKWPQNIYFLFRFLSLEWNRWSIIMRNLPRRSCHFFFRKWLHKSLYTICQLFVYIFFPSDPLGHNKYVGSLFFIMKQGYNSFSCNAASPGQCQNCHHLRPKINILKIRFSSRNSISAIFGHNDSNQLEKKWWHQMRKHTNLHPKKMIVVEWST